MTSAWDISEAYTLRAGYKFLESPIPDRTHSPVLPDADKHMLDLGIGWQGDGCRVDAAYMVSIFDDRDVANNVVPAFNGDFDLSSHILGISCTKDF